MAEKGIQALIAGLIEATAARVVEEASAAVGGLPLGELAGLVESTTARIVEQVTAEGASLAELPGIKLPWYMIRQADTGGRREDGPTEANVYVYNRIGGWFGTSADEFAAELAEVDADVIHLRLNSPGGSVPDALSIMNTLRAHRARVISHVDGYAASAASVIMLAGDEIVVEPGGEIMVHMASTSVAGVPKTLRSVADWLDDQAGNVADLYAQRSGRTVEEWLALMDAETWFFGREAVDAGLADRVETLKRPEYDDEEIAERMRRRHSLRGYRHEGRAAAGAPKIARRTPPAAAVAAARRTAGVTGDVRDAGQFRMRALDRGLMRRSAPAGIATTARRSPPDGDIGHRTVQFRGREMYRTEGMFTVYGRGYEMWDMYGPYIEVIEPAAGKATLDSGPDCVFLLNHTGLTMARTGGPWNQGRGTLNLEEKDHGGWHEAFHNPERADIREMVLAIDDELITEMSFAFMIDVGEWNDDMTFYRIRRYNIDRGDVSSVNYGASPYTSISARAWELLDELEQMPAGAIVEAVRRLSTRVDSYQKLIREVDPGALANVVEPALVAHADSTRGRQPGATAEEKAAADRWVRDAIEDPGGAGPAGSGDEEQAKVIDKTPEGGPTVAKYEALLESITGTPARP